MYNKNYLEAYSGEDDEEYFEYFVRKFVAVCSAEKWPADKWGTKLGYYLQNDIKKKYDKFYSPSKTFEAIVNDLRAAIYKGSYIPINFEKAQKIQQKPRETIHHFSNRVKSTIDKGFVFVKNDEERTRIAVLAFYNGLRGEFKTMLEEEGNGRASNMEEAEVSVLVALNKCNKKNSKCIPKNC